jgi:asparagine synthase (glutamine-hydrolysing)
MCGIGGIVYLDKSKPVDEEELRRICGTMLHRGPDDEGCVIDHHVGLAMRRLNVIDLLTGRQPISNEDGSIWIVFNGEIYNFRELRKQLEKKGHKFSSNSDTETIVHLYEEHGTDCVKQLNGMFAFAIWDKAKQTLLLARDRLGVKPLYYFLDGQRLIFGSELKAILACDNIPRRIDLEALDSFLTSEYVPAPLSIFQGIKKLPAAHILVLSKEKVFIDRYWDLTFTRSTGREEDLSERLYELLKECVRIRLTSDVPFGAFLSGGVDSSAIVSIMSEIIGQPVKTFSIGFDDPSYNELKYAGLVAQQFNTDHHESIVRPNIVDLVYSLIRYLDEPFADVSVFPTYLISKLAREHVTVVLSGDGGDELFAGYEWYVAQKIASYYRQLPGAVRNRWLVSFIDRVPPSSRKKGLINKLKRFIEGAALPESLEHFRWSIFATEETKERLYTEDLKRSLIGCDSYRRLFDQLQSSRDTDSLWRQQVADIRTYLADDILVKVDRMSMANSLEARSPFLDYRLVEFATSLPAHLKLNGLQTKYLLKRCMASKLPRNILVRRKEGFSIPMKNWLKHELRPLMSDLLSPGRIKQQGLFNVGHIQKLIGNHLKGVENNSHQIWPLMMFQIWQDSYLNQQA